MNGFSERINRFIKKHKLERTRRILAVGLSLIVASSVFSYLILPAISATPDADVVTDNTFDVQLFSEANSEYDAILSRFEAVKNDSNKAMNFEQYISNVTVTENEYDATTDTVKCKLEISYGSDTDGAKKYLYYKLGDNIKATSEEIGKVTKVTDYINEQTVQIGNQIITKDGYVIIEVLDEYLPTLQNNFKGKFSYNISVSRKDGENGTQTTITIGNKTYPIKGFEELQLALAKSGAFNKSDGTIEWKVEIDNPGTVIDKGEASERTEPHDLKDYVLSDTMFKAGAQSVVCVDSSGKEITLVDKGDGTYTFPEGSTDKKYTITYKTKLTDDQFKGLDTTTNPQNGQGTVKNKATITKPDGSEPKTDEGEVKFELGYNLSKTGSLDYTDPENPKIKWTLTVNNKYKRPVDGLKITDAMFPADVSEITFTPADVTGTLSGGQLTLASKHTDNMHTGDVTVSFSTEVKDTDISTGTVTNKAKLPGMPEVSKTVNTKPFNLEKSGWGKDYNGNKNYWYIKITNISCDNKDLNGYYLIDSNLPNRVGKEDCGNQDFTSKMDSNNILIKINGKEITDSTKYYTIDEKGKLTFEHLESYGEQINLIEIQYVTQPSEEINNPSYNFKDTNTVNAYTPGDKQIGGSTAEIPWHKEEVKPSISVNKTTNGNYTDNKDGTLTLPWKISFNGQNGGTLATLDKKEFTDTLDNSVDGVSHYITKEQLDSMTFKATDKNNSVVTLEKGKDYTITYVSDADGKATSFTLKFLESEKLSQVTKLEVTYNTTADVSNLKAGSTVQIKNSFNGQTPQFPYEKIEEGATPYNKYDADVDITTQSGTTHKKQSKLEVVSINGVDHYKFDYQIDVNKNGAKFTGLYTLTDTLPNGFSLYNNEVRIKHSWEGNYSSHSLPYDDWDNKIELNNNELLISYKDNNSYTDATSYRYSLVIDKKTFDDMLAAQGSVSITNSIKSDTETHKEITQTQVVEKEQLTKMMLEDFETGVVQYEVAVNPERKDLSSSDTIYLEDILKAGGTGVDPGAVMVSLNSVKVFEIDANGNQTQLDESQYRYVLDNNPKPEASIINPTITKYNRTDTKLIHKISGVPAGASGTIVLKKTSGVDYPYIWVGTDNDNASGIFSGSIHFDDNGTYSIDVDGSKTNGSDIYVGIDKSEGYTVESVTFSSGKAAYPYAAKLGLTVPDGKYLKIQYEYRCSLRSGEDKGSALLINTVEVENSMTTTEKAESKKEISIDSGSTSELTGTPDGTYNFKKVDVGDYSTRLSAKFNLFKYIDGDWKPATSFEEQTDAKGNIYLVPAYDGTAAAELTVPKQDRYVKLEPNKLFKLVETEQPKDYSEGNKGATKYFYSGTKIEGTLPAGVESSQVTLLPKRGNLNIQNYKEISIRAEKRWALGYDRHSNDSVELMLMRSHTKSSTLPDDAEQVMIDGIDNPQIVSSATGWKASWNKLPSGTTDGKPWYYYIKETKVLINGVESKDYTAYYAGNGKNVNSTITVTNTSGLTVMKKWLSNDNTEGKPTVESIRFRLYRSLLPPSEVDSGTVPSDGELIDVSSTLGFVPDKDGWYTLSSTNNWSITFKGLDPYKGDDVNAPYYYYAVENTSNLSQNVVSYLGNGTGSQGVITINNKSTKVTIGEMPSTGGPGTFAYTLTGGLIIICSAAAYVVRKRLLRE